MAYYVQFNKAESRESVDVNFKNAWEGVPPNGTTGRHLYTPPPANQRSNPLAFSGRMRVLDRTMHRLPDHSSRFSVDNGCPNGYCFGHMPGKYMTNGYDANFDPQPPDVAPARFYTNRHQRDLTYSEAKRRDEQLFALQATRRM